MHKSSSLRKEVFKDSNSWIKECKSIVPWKGEVRNQRLIDLVSLSILKINPKHEHDLSSFVKNLLRYFFQLMKESAERMRPLSLFH